MIVDAKEVEGRVRRDSQAVLAQQGFLGDRVIDITPGTKSTEPIPDGGEIPSADQQGLAQIFSGASDILVQFNTVGKQLQELMDNINQGKGTVGKLLHDDALYVNLNRAVLEFQDVGARVTKGDGTLARLLNDPKLYKDLQGAVDNVQGMVSDVRSGKGTLGKLVTDDQFYKQANEVLAKFNSTTEKLDRIAGDIEAGRGSLGKFIKDDTLHDDAQAAIASFRNISDRLDKGEGSAGKFLHDDKLYNNLNQTTAEMVKFLYDFRQNPKKYLSIKNTMSGPSLWVLTDANVIAPSSRAMPKSPTASIPWPMIFGAMIAMTRSTVPATSNDVIILLPPSTSSDLTPRRPSSSKSRVKSTPECASVPGR
jgi:phospholipid/cholesterol/gamma-HCH transport system substrate-binding protein